MSIVKSCGLSWWLRGWRICLQYRRHNRGGFDPWVGKTPWRRKWQFAPVFLPGIIPWTEERGRLLSMGWQRVRYDWAHGTGTVKSCILQIIPCSIMPHTFVVSVIHTFLLLDYWWHLSLQSGRIFRPVMIILLFIAYMHPSLLACSNLSCFII